MATATSNATKNANTNTSASTATQFKTGAQAKTNPELIFSCVNLEGEKVECVFVRHLKAQEIQCRAKLPDTHDWRCYREYKFGKFSHAGVAKFLKVSEAAFKNFMDGADFDLD